MTGRVGMPVALSLAANHEVWGLARFSDSRARYELESSGVRTAAWNLDEGSLSGVPTDFTHILHAALDADHEDSSRAVDLACRSVGRLMSHMREPTAFMFVSSSVVYRRLESGRAHLESDPLGGMSTPSWGPAYAVAKLSAEGAVRALSVALGVPATIARLSVQYGGWAGTGDGRGGVPGRFLRLMKAGRPVPVRPGEDDYCSPLHIDDIVTQVPALWGASQVPPRIVNWGGDESVAIRDLIRALSECARLPAQLKETESAASIVALDPSLRQSLTGECRVAWRDGIRRLVREHRP